MIAVHIPFSALVAAWRERRAAERARLEAAYVQIDQEVGSRLDTLDAAHGDVHHGIPQQRETA